MPSAKRSESHAAPTPKLAHPPASAAASSPSARSKKAFRKPSAEQIAAVEIITDPQAAAKAAGLRYTHDDQPGIHRVKSGKTVRYTDAVGAAVKDEETLARIKSLVIPPAWTDVWITPHANGHLQATGRDARGRKQPRYHPHWREVRDATKYERMSLFANALPVIRERVEHDLRLPNLPRNKVLAAVVSLMEATHIRVGNIEYARENGSYGLTTMENKHVDVHGADIQFTFLGKSKVQHTIGLHDRRLAKIIQRCEEIPGHELFQYMDHDGNHHAIHSDDVNEYLREITGEHFTAKDFRTWAGSVLAASLLRDTPPYTTVKEAKKNVVEAIKAVAAQLGNTPSVCRKCYVHPAVLESYFGGATVQEAKQQIEKELAQHTAALHEEERVLVELLQQRMLLDQRSV